MKKYEIEPSSALNTQRTTIESEMYWRGGLGRLIGQRACQASQVPEQNENGGTRAVTYISHEDGSWELAFDES